jgi:hypothetical protein
MWKPEWGDGGSHPVCGYRCAKREMKHWMLTGKLTFAANMNAKRSA